MRMGEKSKGQRGCSINRINPQTTPQFPTLVKEAQITKRTHFRFWTSFCTSTPYADLHFYKPGKRTHFCGLSRRILGKGEPVLPELWRRPICVQVLQNALKYQLPSHCSLIPCWAFPALLEKGNGLKFLRSCEGRGPQKH